MVNEGMLRITPEHQPLAKRYYNGKSREFLSGAPMNCKEEVRTA